MENIDEFFQLNQSQALVAIIIGQTHDTAKLNAILKLMLQGASQEQSRLVYEEIRRETEAKTLLACKLVLVHRTDRKHLIGCNLPSPNWTPKNSQDKVDCAHYEQKINQHDFN